MESQVTIPKYGNIEFCPSLHVAFSLGLFIMVSVHSIVILVHTVKPVLSGHSKEDKKLVSLNAGQKYLREHSAILLTFIKLTFVFKTFVLSIFEWPLKTGFTAFHFPIFLSRNIADFFRCIYSGETSRQFEKYISQFH